MRRDFAIVLAAAALVIATFGSSAAIPGTAQTASRNATSIMVHEAAIVCGGNGCNAVHTHVQKHRKFQTLGHG